MSGAILATAGLVACGRNVDDPAGSPSIGAGAKLAVSPDPWVRPRWAIGDTWRVAFRIEDDDDIPERAARVGVVERVIAYRVDAISSEGEVTIAGRVEGDSEEFALHFSADGVPRSCQARRPAEPVPVSRCASLVDADPWADPETLFWPGFPLHVGRDDFADSPEGRDGRVRRTQTATIEGGTLQIDFEVTSSADWHPHRAEMWWDPGFPWWTHVRVREETFAGAQRREGRLLEWKPADGPRFVPPRHDPEAAFRAISGHREARRTDSHVIASAVPPTPRWRIGDEWWVGSLAKSELTKRYPEVHQHRSVVRYSVRAVDRAGVTRVEAHEFELRDEDDRDYEGVTRYPDSEYALEFDHGGTLVQCEAYPCNMWSIGCRCDEPIDGRMPLSRLWPGEAHPSFDRPVSMRWRAGLPWWTHWDVTVEGRTGTHARLLVWIPAEGSAVAVPLTDAADPVFASAPRLRSVIEHLRREQVR